MIGVVTTTDLVRHESANPVYLVGEVLKAPSAAALAQISRRLAHLQVQLCPGNVMASNPQWRRLVAEEVERMIGVWRR